MGVKGMDFGRRLNRQMGAKGLSRPHFGDLPLIGTRKSCIVPCKCHVESKRRAVPLLRGFPFFPLRGLPVLLGKEGERTANMW